MGGGAGGRGREGSRIFHVIHVTMDLSFPMAPAGWEASGVGMALLGVSG